MYLSIDMDNYPLPLLPMSRDLVDKLIELRVVTLMMSSEEEDLNFLRAHEVEIDPAHSIIIELGWKRPRGAHGLDVDFSIYETGATTDEAIEIAINQFQFHLEHFPDDPLNTFKEI
jgi:hypothetical protein